MMLNAERLEDVRVMLEQPKVRIDLMYRETAGNDPYYARLVRDFYRDARKPHPKLPVVGRFSWGVALCRLPDRYEQYFMLVDGSARRNFKKAERAGYRFDRIDFNEHLEDIAEIRRSTTVRQGPVPERYLKGEVKAEATPASRSSTHDYPRFGVLQNGKLVAYASCFVAGEVCLVNNILGHAAHQEEGVMPRLIAGIAEYVYARHPKVRYFGYDTYFGASQTLRRFKKKMRFEPYRVRWVLDAPPSQVTPPAGAAYRRRASAPVPVEPPEGAIFHYVEGPLALPLVLGPVWRRLGVQGVVGVTAKVAAARRQYYCVVQDDQVTADGWVTQGRGHDEAPASVEPLIVPTPTGTGPGRAALGTYALRSAANALYARGFSQTRVDAPRGDDAMQKVLAQSGYEWAPAAGAGGGQAPRNHAENGGLEGKASSGSGRRTGS
jgi:hypothetical protein